MQFNFPPVTTPPLYASLCVYLFAGLTVNQLYAKPFRQQSKIDLIDRKYSQQYATENYNRMKLSSNRKIPLNQPNTCHTVKTYQCTLIVPFFLMISLLQLVSLDLSQKLFLDQHMLAFAIFSTGLQSCKRHT